MASQEVNIVNMAFDPAVIDIQVGDTITWANQDAMGHSACRDSHPAFDTGLIAAGNIPDPIGFTTPGSFDYFCRQHRFMVARVVVS